MASRLLVASWNQFVILWKRYIEIIWLFPKKRKKVTNKAEHNTRPFIKRYSISSLYNRPFARWRRFTTTSYRILPGFSFLCKLVLAFWMNIVTLLPMENFYNSLFSFFTTKNHFVPNKTKDTLYVFFPHSGPCDVTQEKSFFQILSDPRERKCDIIYENLLRPLSDLNGGNKTCKLKKSLRSRLLEGSCWWWNKFPSLSFRYIAAFHFTEQNRKESSAKATRPNVPEILLSFSDW